MQLTGIGLYTFREAALLTRVPLRDLRRWLDGYSYRDKKHGPVSVAPLWETELADDALDGVSFHDLLEVRFVDAFRKHGNLPPALARALHALSESGDHAVSRLRQCRNPGSRD